MKPGKLPKIIVVLGPTATGKSDLAVEIAKKYNGEVISADSRQVYRGMDLGTGKITRVEMQGVTHFLLDVVNPKSVFNVEKYQKLADKSVRDILSRGKLPIICGGTGFYIQSIVDNISLPKVEPNPSLRKKLEKKNCGQLLKILAKLDSKTAAKIDQKNSRKIIRAIEIATALGSVPILEKNPKYESLQIGLTIPDKILKDRIYLRLTRRLAAGMLNEGKKLHRDGLSWKRMENLGLEYRYMARHLSGKISYEQMISELDSKIWQYARRQKTWFRRDKRIKWFNPLKKTDIMKVLKEVNKFLFF
ncbi:MAG: tRNA (adenosine(37)-N6)-dimethylallyltransferase MiaA [bacterium]